MKFSAAFVANAVRSISLRTSVCILLFTTGLVVINYTLHLEHLFRNISPWPLSMLAFFLFYLFVFGIAWIIQQRFAGERLQGSKKLFLLLLIIAPFLFSLKMIWWNIAPILATFNTPATAHYWDILLQWPLKFFFLLMVIYYIWKLGKYPNPFFGFSFRGFSLLPYLLLLVAMIPMIALAATRPDFQHAYPKLKTIAFISNYASPLWPKQLLFELCYGIDFFSIELFFRGFLVLGFLRFAGKEAILPMAAFYCTVHFGKPLGECITSFFGGIILGVVAAETNSILGGLLVHLGIAWMMEWAGYLGNVFG